MKIFEVALFVICIQFAGAMISSSGLFGGSTYYENQLGNFNFSSNLTAASETEQNQISFSGISGVINTLKWEWITPFFGNAYNTDADVRNYVNHIKLFLTIVSNVLIAAAAIEFFRNQAKVL